MHRAVILSAVFSLACVPPDAPARTDTPAAIGSIAVSTTASHATAMTSSSASEAPVSSAALLEDGPVPEPWGCPPIDAPIEQVAETTARVLGASGADLFWADGEGVWMQSPGAQAKKIARGMAHVPPAQLIVTDDDVLLLSTRAAGSTCSSVVQTISRSGATPAIAKTIFSGRCIKHVAASKTHVAFLVATYSPAEDWTSGNAFLLDRAKGGQPTKLDLVLPEVGALALTSTQLFATFNSGRLQMSRLENPNRFEMVTKTSAVRLNFASDDARFLSLDDSFAYLYSTGATNAALRVLRVKLDGGVPEVVGLFQRDKTRLAGSGFVASERYIYFTIPSEGAVYRADKKGKCGVERVAEGRTAPLGLTFLEGAIHWTEATKPPAIFRRKE